MFSLSNISRYCLCKKKKKRNVVDNFPGILMDKCITLSIFFKQVKNVLAHLIQLKFIVMEFDDTIVSWQKDVSQSKKIILKKILYTEHVHLTLLWFSLWSVNEFSTCFEAGSMMRIVLEKKKTCMPLLTL